MTSSRIALYGFFSLVAAAYSTPAKADESPAQNKVIVNDPDDRLSTVPTNWWTYSHQSPQDVTNTTSSQNARIVDITVEQVAPSLTLTVTYVENTGPYYKGWLWYAGADAPTIDNAIAANNARLTSLKPFDAGGGQIRFMAVLILNAGKDTKPSWYYTDLTSDQIATNLAANNARLLQISSYLSGGKTHYAVVMVAKTANDPQFWWYTGQTPAQITSLLSANNARLVDLDYTSSDGTYNAVMAGCGAGGCPASWWYTGQTPTQMQAMATQNAGRVTHSTSYAGCGGLCLSFIAVDNTLPPLDGSTAITTRVGQLLRAGGINGVQGLYLKQVGGPVLANLEESFIYEPASSIKVLAHLYAMTQVQNGAATLADSLQQYTNGSESCPDPAQLGGMEPLSTALQEMMWHSDNARTREITDTYGAAKITAFGLSIGMQNSQINHIIGCAGPIPDQLTLADAATLYEGVANGTFLTPANQTALYSLMAGKAQFQAEGYDWTHLWDTDIPAMIAQAAPAATPAQQRNYQNMMNLAYKAGNYVICADSCSHVTEYIAITGWVQIPFCSGGAPAPQDYVFGLFFHGPTDNSYNSTKTTVATQNFLTAKGELLREQLTAGLASCGMTP
jgi:X-X-X-Leu-X-X-Gly heptad repeat protein